MTRGTVLVAGESWVTRSTHVKGVDEFTVHSYTEGLAPLRRALEKAGYDVEHLPAHLVPGEFPNTVADLSGYDAVVLSDIGANSINLATGLLEGQTYGHDRIGALVEWTRNGGALVMIGGYLSFSGFQARGAFHPTALPQALPVDLLPTDDRVETPGGLTPAVVDADHPIVAGIEGAWPSLLGYNRVIAKPDAHTIATIGADPLVVVGEFGEGRSAVFTSDCSPHWAPPAFCEEWDGYDTLFAGLLDWVTGR